MKAYQNALCEMAFFSALAVYRGSPAFEHHRFCRDYHAYNRFTAMALKAGIAWHLGPKNYDRLNLTFVSDAKDRSTRPDRGDVDNFEDYIPYRAEMDAFLSRVKGKKSPYVQVRLELRDSAIDDLLQLADLLLGATQEALVAGSTRETKQELGKMVLRWYRDLKQEPWRQEYQLLRKFNLWAFPDENGRPYNPSVSALDEPGAQLRLF